MAQQHPHNPSTETRRPPEQRRAAPSRVGSAAVAADVAGAGRQRQVGHRDTTARRGRPPRAAGAPLQVHPPVLVPMTEEQEATAIALLSELIGTRAMVGARVRGSGSRDLHRRLRELAMVGRTASAGLTPGGRTAAANTSGPVDHGTTGGRLAARGLEADPDCGRSGGDHVVLAQEPQRGAVAS